MTLDLDDTIAAIASASGGGARGIVRISGPRSTACVNEIFAAAGKPPIPERRTATATRGTLKLTAPLGDVPALLYLWPNERSYTRQPAAELHLPGSPPILEAALATVCRAGARLARPGEFTLRAFLAGQLDLTQAEAVLGVIDAQSQAELDASLSQLAGGLAQPLFALRERLLDLLSHLEAGLDFVEEDITFISAEQLDGELAAAASAMSDLADRMSARGEAGRVPRVVLVGRPNAGKSSLLNALAGGNAAIVSPVAGTTRDYVACRVQLAGSECLLIDTAGAAEIAAASAVEGAAQAAMHDQCRQADLTLICLDTSQTPSDSERILLETLGRAPHLIVLTKCDLLPSQAASELDGLRTSSRTGAGIDDLRRAIAAELQAIPGESSVVAGTAERCRESLRLAAGALQRAGEAARARHGEELVAAEVRLALESLGEVVGAVYTDDLLDRIFSRFCIGK